MTKLADQGVQLLLRNQVERFESLQIRTNILHNSSFDRCQDSPCFALKCAADPCYLFVQLAFGEGQLKPQHRPYEDNRGCKQASVLR